MKLLKLSGKFILLCIIFLSLNSICFGATDVNIVDKPIQKILYDDDKSVNNKEYIGWAVINSATSASVWKIMRISYIGNDFTIEWADGNALYDNIFDNRATTVTYK